MTETRSIPTTKGARQQTIVELLTRHAVRSQTELGELLAAAGLHVTQATLSRDLDSPGQLVAAIPRLLRLDAVYLLDGPSRREHGRLLVRPPAPLFP